MPGYVQKQLIRFRPTESKHAASPSSYAPPVMGPQVTFVDNSPLLSGDKIKWVQAVVGAFQFYARAIDPTMLTAVYDIASPGGPPTERLITMCERLMAYAAAYPDNELRFYKSDMILETQADASYLSRSKARSVAGGIAYLTSKGDGTPSPIPNGAVATLSQIIDVVVASVAEAEYASVFKNGQAAAWLRVVLGAMGHIQPATDLWTDNGCAVGLANDTLKIKRSKSIDMRFHWVRDRIRQGQLKVKWQKGATNLADFFTKALPVHEHQEIMHKLVHVPHNKTGSARSARRTQRARARRFPP